MTVKNHKINALILDMDGVIWRSYQPIGNLPWVFQTTQALGLKVALATNNSSKTRGKYLQKLADLGVTIQPEQIFTSSTAMAYLLKKRFPQGGPLFIIGEEGLLQPLTEAGFYHQEEAVLAVVAGLDRKFSFELLSKATFLIRSGLPFYGTNPDRSFPTPKGLGPGAGAIMAAIEAATDVPPIIAGKPSEKMIQPVLEYLGVAPENALIVGDRIETDILSGQNAGCQTALLLSGVSTLEDYQNCDPKPDYVAQDLQALIQTLFLSETNNPTP